MYAIKQSMKQVFLDGKRVPVTLLKTQKHLVIGQRTIDKDGYSACILGVGQTKKARHTNKALQGSLKKNKIKIVPQRIREVKNADLQECPIGNEINLEDILIPNSEIQATGTSKGKGFTGVIKRWNFSAQNRTHGQSDRRRAPGSIGRGTTPGRVLPGKKMAGHHGNQTITVTNIKIISYEPEKHLLTVSGPVPGARNGLVKITILKPAPKVKVKTEKNEIKEVKQEKEVKEVKTEVKKEVKEVKKEIKKVKKESKPEVSKDSEKK